MSGNLTRLMIQVDFGRPVATIYQLLLTDSPLSTARLNALTGQRSDIVLSTIQQLIRLRLVGKTSQRGTEVYYASPPVPAWRALIADLVWENVVTLARPTALPETDDSNIESLRMLCREIGIVAHSLYKPFNAARMHKERDAADSRELEQLTWDVVYHAQRYVFAVSKLPLTQHLASFWSVLTERIDSGVRYHRITDLEEMIKHGLDIVERDMTDFSIDLRILERNLIGHKYYLVDGTSLIVYHNEDRADGGDIRGVGRVTSMSQIVKRYKRRFDDYKARSIPGRFAVQHLRVAGETLLDRARTTFSAEEVVWLAAVVSYGKFLDYKQFSKLHPEIQWSQERFDTVRARALKAGLVRHNLDRDLVPAYPADENTLRSAFTLSSEQ